MHHTGLINMRKIQSKNQMILPKQQMWDPIKRVNRNTKFKEEKEKFTHRSSKKPIVEGT